MTTMLIHECVCGSDWHAYHYKHAMGTYRSKGSKDGSDSTQLSISKTYVQLMVGQRALILSVVKTRSS